MFFLLLGGKKSDLHPMDGQDIWPDLNGQIEIQERTILHNIDQGNEAIRIGKWKYIKGI